MNSAVESFALGELLVSHRNLGRRHVLEVVAAELMNSLQVNGTVHARLLGSSGLEYVFWVVTLKTITYELLI